MIARSWAVAFFFAFLAGCGGGVNSGGGTENGPGVVLTQAVNPTTGGALVVNSPNNPLNGTVVTIPPNALGGSEADTVTIAYSDTLPGPIDSAATAAGATVASKVIQISHTSTADLAGSITVTVPYDTSSVGPNEVPVVLYWDDSINQYDSMRVVSFDRTAGTITFRTHHFSSYVVEYVKGLFAALSGTIPAPPAISNIDTGFTPAQNGFAVVNFDSADTWASGGACYGLAAFADWSFSNKQPPLFSNYFGSTNPLRANPLEMDLARDLIYETFKLTKPENGNVISDIKSFLASSPSSSWDAWTAQKLVSYMLTTHKPQILALFQNRDPNNTGSKHAVLVYKWDQAQGFTIYDPNVPGVPQSINFKWPTFSSYTSGGTNYQLFGSDAPSSWFSDDELGRLNAGAATESGYPYAITILPEDSSALATDGSLMVDPVNGITVSASENVPPTPARTPNPSLSAYFYVNGAYVGPPVGVANGSYSMHLPPLPAGTTSEELLVIVAGSPPTNTSPANQSGISSAYFGSARATLKPASPPPSAGGFSNISLSCKRNSDGTAQVTGLYSANLLPGEDILADSWPTQYLTGYTSDCQNPTYSAAPGGVGDFVNGEYLAADCTPSTGLQPTTTGCNNPQSGEPRNISVTVNTTVSQYIVSTGSMLMMLCRGPINGVPFTGGRPTVSIDTVITCN